MSGLFGLFFLFFRIGLFSFGGGYAMLPLIYQGIRSLGFMSAEEFSRLVALSQMTPGPIAANAATYVGYQQAGLLGAVVATVGVILPALLLVSLVSHFVVKFKESRGLRSVLDGVRPATLGLLGSAAVFLGQGSLFVGTRPVPLLIFFCLVVIYFAAVRKIHPITLTILAGVAGAFFVR